MHESLQLDVCCHIHVLRCSFRSPKGGNCTGVSNSFTNLQHLTSMVFICFYYVCMYIYIYMCVFSILIMICSRKTSLQATASLRSWQTRIRRITLRIRRRRKILVECKIYQHTIAVCAKIMPMQSKDSASQSTKSGKLSMFYCVTTAVTRAVLLGPQKGLEWFHVHCKFVRFSRLVLCVSSLLLTAMTSMSTVLSLSYLHYIIILFGFLRYYARGVLMKDRALISTSSPTAAMTMYLVSQFASHLQPALTWDSRDSDPRKESDKNQNIQKPNMILWLTTRITIQPHVWLLDMFPIVCQTQGLFYILEKNRKNMPYCSCTRPMAHSTTEHPMMKVSNRLGKNLPCKYVCGLYSTPKNSPQNVWWISFNLNLYTCIHTCHVCSGLGSFPIWELGHGQKVLASINPHLHCRQQIHGQFSVHKCTSHIIANYL